MNEQQPIDLDDLHRVAARVRLQLDDNWLADMVEIAAAEIARLREERLTVDERDRVAGIALILDRLKMYPEQVGSTKQDDLDLLWRIAGVPEIDATLAGMPSYATMAVEGFPVLPVPDMAPLESAPAASGAAGRGLAAAGGGLVGLVG